MIQLSLRSMLPRIFLIISVRSLLLLYEAAGDVLSHLPFHTRINYAGKCAAERVLRYHCPIGIITRKMEIFTKTRKIVHGNPAVLNL